MVGITSYGIYVPFNRLQRSQIARAYGKKVMSGEKAVANYDEDSVTMGIAAALNCMASQDIGSTGALYFASTTSPFREKQSASLVASVLDIDGAIRTADFGGTLKAGSNAMLAAIDAANREDVLVSIADCRVPPGDGGYEVSFGDGAASFRFGSKNIIAEFVGSFSVSYDFYDVWRADNEKYPHFFEDKYALTMGYKPFLSESVKGVLKKTGVSADQITRVVIDGANDKQVAAVLPAVGLKPEQLQEGLIKEFGYTGAAYAPMLLACALEQSSPGDLILYVSYGEGSDAILFRACEGCQKIGAGRGLNYFRTNKKNDMNYEKYLKWRDLIDVEPARRPALLRSNLPDYYRKRKKNLTCCGSRCTKCGTPYFPPTRVCVKCKSVDQMEPYHFLGQKAYLATYTLDNLGVSKDSPNVFAIVDFEGGGRLFTYMMDCYFDKIEIGMPVELVFRNMFTSDGINTYFWKCIPLN